MTRWRLARPDTGTRPGTPRSTFPNASEAYRSARRALLAEEVASCRHVERAAAQRRALPAGGEVPGLSLPRRTSEA